MALGVALGVGLAVFHGVDGVGAVGAVGLADSKIYKTLLEEVF